MILLAKERTRSKETKRKKESVKAKSNPKKQIKSTKKAKGRAPKGKLWRGKPVEKPSPFYFRMSKFTKKSGALKKQGEKQEKKYLDYMKKGLIPVLWGRASYLISFDEIQAHLDARPNDSEVEWVAESSEKMSGFADKDEIKKGKTFNTVFQTLKGNQVQTQIDKKTGEFMGLYYQNGVFKDATGNPIPQLFRPEKIRVDPDPIGHFQAWFINNYAWSEKDRKKHPHYKTKSKQIENLVSLDGEMTGVTFLLAMKGLAGSIVDSKAFRRNNIVRTEIKDKYTKSALAYLPKGVGQRSVDISVSDQMVRACGLIVSEEVDIDVKTPSFTVSFPEFEPRQFDEDKPILKFVSTIEAEVKPLDSDTLLLIATRKMQMDSVTVQNLLEALYNQKWISYPRASATKAEAESIKIKNPKTGKIVESGEEARELVNREFRGSLHEKQLLDLVVDSQIALKKKKPFTTIGAWHLISGDLDLQSKRTDFPLILGEKEEYSADSIDIVVGERGILEEELVAQLIYENVATPATRTGMLDHLRNAGMLSRRAGRLVVDRRGYYLAGLDRYYEKKNISRAYTLKNNIYDSKTPQEIAGWGKKFEWLDESEMEDVISFVTKEVNRIVEAEQDLAYLDREGRELAITG